MQQERKHICPCCNKYIFQDKWGSHEICPICFWEDDLLQTQDENYRGGSNKLSLKECRENYKKYGISEQRFTNSVSDDKGR